MEQAFVIMRIGDSALDRIFKEVFSPTLVKLGYEPKRVDKHNKGGLLKSEIMTFIEESPIIVADLTDERPNCYLEIGYTMGRGKFKNLILTAREDHNVESPNHQNGGPKVHFDLGGYEILYWDENDLQGFRTELERRIRRRMEVINGAGEILVGGRRIDDFWVQKNRNYALASLKKTGKAGFMEGTFFLQNIEPKIAQDELLRAAKESEINTFGFPIAAVLSNDAKPIPSQEGVYATIPSVWTSKQYNYWALRTNGDFYFLETLFEDDRELGKALFYNIRIVKVTEVFLYIDRLYKSLKIDKNEIVEVSILHGGLGNRILGSSKPGRIWLRQATCKEDNMKSTINFKLSDIEKELVSMVEETVAPLFLLFDFTKIDNAIIADIVGQFKSGRVT